MSIPYKFKEINDNLSSGINKKAAFTQCKK